MLKNMALGPQSRQKPRPTASVFVYLSPSGHVFNIACQAMIKTYSIELDGIKRYNTTQTVHFSVPHICLLYLRLCNDWLFVQRGRRSNHSTRAWQMYVPSKHPSHGSVLPDDFRDPTGWVNFSWHNIIHWPPGDVASNFKSITFKLVWQKSRLGTRRKIALSWMPQNLTNEKSTLVQLTANKILPAPMLTYNHATK